MSVKPVVLAKGCMIRLTIRIQNFYRSLQDVLWLNKLGFVLEFIELFTKPATRPVQFISRDIRVCVC